MISLHQTKAARIASVIAAGTLVFGVTACGGDDDVDEVENEVEDELDEVEDEVDEVEDQLRDP